MFQQTSEVYELEKHVRVCVVVAAQSTQIPNINYTFTLLPHTETCTMIRQYNPFNHHSRLIKQKNTIYLKFSLELTL